MRKNIIRISAAVAVAAGLAVGGAAIATAQDDSVLDIYPSVSEQQAIWNEGGAEVGGGAAKMVSAAWIGIPAQAMDYFEEGFGYMGGTSMSPVK